MLLVHISLAVVVLSTCSVSVTHGSPGIWTRSPGRAESYQVSKEEMIWGDAWDYCVQEEGHLLVLETKQEVDFIKTLIDYYGLTASHVGLHDLFKAEEYATIFGQPMSTTAFEWSSGEPNNKKEHCVALNAQATVYDIVCDRKLLFICEKINEL